MELESVTMIYLDNNATTPLDSRVRERLIEVLDSAPANASSRQHSAGRLAHEIVEDSRRQAAEALDVAPSQLVWTSGASEAIAMAVFGVVAAAPATARTILLSPTEHKAVIAAAESCVQTLGARILYLDIDESGRVVPDSVPMLIYDTVCLVAVMHSNNETGVINPVAEIADKCRATGARLLIDCTQSLGKVDVSAVMKLADLCPVSAHKTYGPKGVGALILNRGVKRTLVSIGPGGGQESGLRGGTHNTAGIAAAALALEIGVRERGADADKARSQVGMFWAGIRSRIPDVAIVTGTAERLPNTMNIRFAGTDAEAVMANAPELALSTGSACNSANPEPSHVLRAMGLQRVEADECIRVSTGRFTTDEEIARALVLLSDAVTRVRRLTAA